MTAIRHAIALACCLAALLPRDACAFAPPSSSAATVARGTEFAPAAGFHGTRAPVTVTGAPRTDSTAVLAPLHMSSQPSGNDDFKFKQPMLDGVNGKLLRAFLAGEGSVLAFAWLLTNIAGLNPWATFSFTPEAAAIGAAVAVPLFLVSVLLERSNLPLFKRIDRDTQLFVVQLLGTKRDVPGCFPATATLSAAAAIAEEWLFRGVVQVLLSAYFGPIPGLVISSLLFGLAHAPVPGASALVESGYGLAFGLTYGLTGNFFAPIFCHFVYDLASLIEVHLRATSNVGLAAGGKLPEPTLSQAANNALKDSAVKETINNYSLPPLFLEQAVGIFRLLDLDDNGRLDKNELKLALRTFGRFASGDQMDSIFNGVDSNGDGLVEFGEFFKALAGRAAEQQRLVRGRK